MGERKYPRRAEGEPWSLCPAWLNWLGASWEVVSNWEFSKEVTICNFKWLNGRKVYSVSKLPTAMNLLNVGQQNSR